MDSVIRMMILVGIIGSAVALTNNSKDSKVVGLVRKINAAYINKPTEVTAPSSVVVKVAAQNSFGAEAEILSNEKAAALKEDLELDLREIKERRLVDLINDPRANAVEKDDAIRFMNEYLRKLTEYMKLRNQELTALAEKNNG